MICVQTGSRLHFGLLSLPPDDNQAARCFGGVGLMVERPGVRLAISPASDWSADGRLAERALSLARRFSATLPADCAVPQRISVEWCAPEHAGLGTGTQLGLAVARALAAAHGLAHLDGAELARRVGRGTRSAIGVHGFSLGGFLVDGGRTTADQLAPLVARIAFPDAWRLVLVVPRGTEGVHGNQESQIFEMLRRSGLPAAATEALCRLVLLGMLPALAESDLAGFSEALSDFNTRAGEAFAVAQGGIYASPRVAEVVAFIRKLGVRGVGQSSWGPTVFAIVEDTERAEQLAQRVRAQFGLSNDEVVVTAARNQGAIFEDAEPQAATRQPG